MVTGRTEAKAVRQWKEKAEQLGFVRRAMAPLGGRRDKQILRDYMNMWKEFVEDNLGEKKIKETTKEYFKIWKQTCLKSQHIKRVHGIIKAMVLGNSLSSIFGVWKDLWEVLYKNYTTTMKDRGAYERSWR